MNKQLIITLLSLLSCIASWANTQVSVNNLQGAAGDTVMLTVNCTHSGAAVAMEIILPLTEGESYIAGSAQLVPKELTHQLSVAQVGEELRIYLYSLSLSNLPTLNGELLHLQLRLGNLPKSYSITPQVMVSNAAGATVPSSANAGQCTVFAPYLEFVQEQINFGHIPIRSTYTQNLTVRNSGNAPLQISGIQIDKVGFTANQNWTIAAGATQQIPIQYAPLQHGAITGQITITSNAINTFTGKHTMLLTADPYSVNELRVGSAIGIADSVVYVPITMNNMENIVALQFCFKLPTALVYESVRLSARSNGHNVMASQSNDTLTVYVYSLSNNALVGNDGEVLKLAFRLNGKSGTYSLRPLNVWLATIHGENYCSASYNGSVRIQSPQFNGASALTFDEQSIVETAVALIPSEILAQPPFKWSG